LAHADASAATKCDAPSAEQCRQQIHRIIHSPTFRTALTLQQLFQFVADKAIAGTTEGLKEYTIGVEAFGRREDFDPKTDPIVRVQIHRLRQKLKEYYDAEGNRDPILIEIPKGHYLPSFESATGPEENLSTGTSSQQDTTFPTIATPLLANNVEPGDQKTSPGGRRSGWLLWSRVAIAVTAIAVFAGGFWAGNRQPRNGAGGEVASSSPEK